jgi:hypothetical protein
LPALLNPGAVGPVRDLAVVISGVEPDRPANLAQVRETCRGVQATIKKTTGAGSTLEKVEVEEESGGTQYGAKITDKNGLRWEIIMDSSGRVVKTEQKKAKK